MSAFTSRISLIFNTSTSSVDRSSLRRLRRFRRLPLHGCRPALLAYPLGSCGPFLFPALPLLLLLLALLGLVGDERLECHDGLERGGEPLGQPLIFEVIKVVGMEPRERLERLLAHKEGAVGLDVGPQRLD